MLHKAVLKRHENGGNNQSKCRNELRAHQHRTKTAAILRQTKGAFQHQRRLERSHVISRIDSRNRTQKDGNQSRQEHNWIVMDD